MWKYECDDTRPIITAKANAQSLHAAGGEIRLARNGYAVFHERRRGIP